MPSLIVAFDYAKLIGTASRQGRIAKRRSASRNGKKRKSKKNPSVFRQVTSDIWAEHASEDPRGTRLIIARLSLA